MRAPNPAESLSSSPFPNTEIANQIISPASPEVRTSPNLGRAIGRASVVLTTISLASLGASAAGTETAHNPGEHRAAASTANNHRLDNITRVANNQNIYTGRVTITAARRAKTEREPSTTENDAIAVGKIMGIPVANVTQGKNSEVSIGGRKIDLADYTTTHRKAEAWTDARTGDCLWNFAIQDIGMASKKAGLDAKQTEAAMTSVTNIRRVMAGYLVDNPELKANPNLVLTGKEYVAKHAREEADELVAAMRAAQSPDVKPAPPAKKPQAAKPNPDLKKPAHTAPKVETGASAKEMLVATTKVLSKSLLALAAVVGVAGGFIGLRRRHRRRQEEAAVEAAASSPTGKHRPPDGPGDGDRTTPPDDFSDLREDKADGHDIVGSPTGAHAAGSGLGKSPYAPPAGSTRPPVLPVAPTAPPDIRARFGAPRLIERPIDRRRLRSVPVSGAQADTIVSIRRAFAQAPTAPEANIKDAPTDPAGASVYPFRRREPAKAPGWFDPKTGEKLPEYRGAHRREEEPAVRQEPTIRVEHIAARVGMHRTPHATDIPEAAVASA